MKNTEQANGGRPEQARKWRDRLAWTAAIVADVAAIAVIATNIPSPRGEAPAPEQTQSATVLAGQNEMLGAVEGVVAQQMAATVIAFVGNTTR